MSPSLLLQQFCVIEMIQQQISKCFGNVLCNMHPSAQGAAKLFKKALTSHNIAVPMMNSMAALLTYVFWSEIDLIYIRPNIHTYIHSTYLLVYDLNRTALYATKRELFK